MVLKDEGGPLCQDTKSTILKVHFVLSVRMDVDRVEIVVGAVGRWATRSGAESCPPIHGQTVSRIN